MPVELPDLKGRESILRLHAKKVKLGPDCDFGVVARMTPGASGAELANIVNEAALCAVRHHRKAVTQFDLQEAVDTILAGAQKKNKILNDKEKCIVAYHEVGHALVAALQSHSAPVQKITIVPRTSGALGFTMQVEDGDHTLMTKEEILNKIATLTGGRAAEELIFHSITTGASNDIEQATKLARALVTRYGMTEDFDMVALETGEQRLPGRRREPGLQRADGGSGRCQGRGDRAGRAQEGLPAVGRQQAQAGRNCPVSVRKRDDLRRGVYAHFERTAAVTGGAFGRFHKSGAINLCGCCWFAP